MSDDPGSRSGSSLPSISGLESGTYESHADSEHVWVRRDITGEAVRARLTGYPEDFTFEPGDETGIEMVDGTWHTLPSVAHTVRLADRIEWWTKNRTTGHFRFLTALATPSGSGAPGSSIIRGAGA